MAESHNRLIREEINKLCIQYSNMRSNKLNFFLEGGGFILFLNGGIIRVENRIQSSELKKEKVKELKIKWRKMSR